MDITTFKNYFTDRLIKSYSHNEVNSFFYMLTNEFLDLSRLDIALDPTRELSRVELEIMESNLRRLQGHEPVQYITGKTEFFGLEFTVDKNVLIPRPETEELVEWILNDAEALKEIKILDVGTGSGCIAISLARNLPGAQVTAVDISPGALQVAMKNAQLNKVDLEFLELDILSPVRLDKKFDIIVSNPPYVRELEKKQMHKNVLDHEPKSALYVPDEDPLLFYRRISDLATEYLEARGTLYFEVNQYLGYQTEQLLAEKNFQTTLKSDIFGVHRMLRGISI